MKYPRTPHLPWSPGGTSDDRRLGSVASLVGVPLVCTEKADGSNVCLERNQAFARSHAAAPSHPSFDAFKALHAEVRHRIPEPYQMFGEWLWARHSIHYTALPGYFLMFGVRDLRNGMWASWDEVTLWAEELGVSTVAPLGGPVVVSTARELADRFAAPKGPSLYGAPSPEGFVIRAAGEFPDEAFGTHVAKWVRSGHVQTSEHWKNQQIVRNLLRGDIGLGIERAGV